MCMRTHILCLQELPQNLLYAFKRKCTFSFEYIHSGVGSNGNGRHYQDQTDRKNEQTMTQDKDLIFAQHTFFCFSATAQVAHLVLPDTQRQRFAKPKEPLFSNALNTAFQNFTNFATK